MFASDLFSPLCPRCQHANLRLCKCQCLKLSLFKHNFVWASSRQDKIVCKRGRTKTTLYLVALLNNARYTTCLPSSRMLCKQGVQDSCSMDYHKKLELSEWNFLTLYKQ